MLKISFSFACIAFALATAAHVASAHPKPQDRVYTADQNSNTVSVINPATNELLGQIRLGNARPDILSPLYKGEVNVHGLGFSPDRRTLLAVSTGSNSVTFIDTATNTVKGVTYIGRSPHEGFFTADGKEVWVVVRGENYISVIDPATFNEVRRIETRPGPGMVLFHPNGKLAFVVSSFSPVAEVVDVKAHKVIKRLPVVSPFSPFLQFTPDYKEVWMTHKDVGKVTRIDTDRLEVKCVIDTGFITNHLGVVQTADGTRAYVTVGGENAVKVYTTDDVPKLVATIPVGALPHGIWPSDDGSRIYVGLENGDAVDVIDTAGNKVIARIPVGQAPQALVYVSEAAPAGAGASNLAPLANKAPINVQLAPVAGDGKGFVVVRNLGLVDALDVSLFELKPQTVYAVYASGQKTPVAILKTNATGAANATAIGPLREVVSSLSAQRPAASKIIVMEGDTPADPSGAVLVGS
jgi:YVTN family beta-propeller protein